MTTVATRAAASKNGFDVIATAFVQEAGLPFASVLDAESIRGIFREEEALFGQEDVFSTEIVLWAFLAQVLRDGKGVACSAAVGDIATYLLQTGRHPPCGDTGDYCRARAKLPLRALQRLVVESAEALEAAAANGWLWKGRHAKLVDGFTFTMPDTPANQHEFPQLRLQEPGVGFPIARACVVLSLATACVCDAALGPYEGKETGETALLRSLLDRFDENDVVVFDRYYCSFMMLALLRRQGAHVCTRQHQLRSTDFRRGRRLGPGDHLVTWHRPQRPTWMSPESYEQVPETMTLRELRFDVTVSGRRVETLTVVTTLTNSEVYSQEEIAELYGFRWNAELDILQIKQTLHLDHVGRFFAFLFIFAGVWQMFGGNFGGGLWIAFIGWFLDNAASGQVQHVMFQGLLSGHTVSQAMSADCAVVSADLTLQELVDEHILGGGRRCFLVNRGDATVGLMTLHRIKEVPRSEWATTSAAQVMLPWEQLKRIDPDTELWAALQKMDRDGVNQLPVTRDHHVLGMLSREGVITFLRTLRELGT